MQRVLRLFRLPLTAAAVLALGACGGGDPVKGAGNGTGTINGVVVKGAVSGATVTAYKLDASMNRSASLATAATASDGTFTLKVSAYNGALELVASAGSYIEEALGTSIQMAGHDLSAVVADFQSGATLSVTVSPVSTMAASLARYHVQKKGEALATALNDAYTHLNAHFGNLDWRSVTPADVTSASVANLTTESTAGLILAGLSYEAKTIAVNGGVTPGLVVNGATLAGVLAQDAADGTLDGYGLAGQLSQSSYLLDGQTVRQFLGQSIVQFVESPQNGSRLTATDVRTLATNIAADSDPYLFCPNQTPASTCAGGTIDLDPPVVTFVQPTAGSGVHGSVAILVTAKDASHIASLSFTAPAKLVGTMPIIDNTTNTATLAATLDVSAMPDGPLAIVVAAADQFANSITQTLKVIVANHGPVITVTTPVAGGTVNGSVAVTASAAAQAPGGSITSLVLVSPPGGMGADLLPAADSFSAQWDTTKALEGPTRLHFQATDSYGLTTDAYVTVTVDNVPFGLISVSVSAGAPIQGALVKVVAIDDNTGAINTTPGGPSNPAPGVNGVLGQCNSTDASGACTITLTAENYTGPIQVLAIAPAGASLTFTDPTNPPSVVTIPSSLALTSFVGGYTTGSALTVPVTLWTSLADVEALAYVKGLHRKYPTTHTVTSALTFGDHLFAQHDDAVVPAWNLRAAVPVLLTQPPTRSLTDVVYAAFPDVALSQLAHDTSVKANLGSGGVITAASLLVLLEQDLAADGQFDGLGAGGVQIQTPGSPPVMLDANFTRVYLADALDEFMQSSRNMTGLTRNDLNNAGVYQAISNDTSDLYGAQAPIPFDSTPPTVTVVATYGVTGVSPVGAGKYVSGTVNLTITATDASGVASLALSVGGTSVPGTFTKNPDGSALLVATYDTTKSADGALTFTVTATDTRFNTGTTPYVLTVDNTPPAIAAAAPSATTFYSSSVPFSAMATDAGVGVSSLSVTGFAGLTNSSLATGQFIGTWSIPAGQVDGPVAGRYVACDLVGNCTGTTTGSVSVNVDRTPPAVTINAPGAPVNCVGSICYTNQSSVTLTGTVSDGTGAGVGGVQLRNNAGQVLPAALTSGTWTATVGLSAGNNSIAVWGTDLASPPNSGSATPASVALTLVTASPTPSVTTAVSYFDESQMTVATDTNGMAIAPAHYQFPAGAVKSTVGHASTVNKAATRLGWTTQPTAAQLEADDGTQLNIPFVQFAVPYTAPVVSATWTLSTTIGGTTATHTGDLTAWQSPKSSASGTYYDLPIASNLLPELANAPAGSALPVSFSMSVKDAAGNPATYATDSLTFNVIGPPIAFVEDSSYPSATDVRSTYSYSTANGTYMNMFNATNPAFGPEGAVRLVRYIVTNPAPTPIAVAPIVTQGASATWSDIESYADQVRTWTGIVTDDGFGFANTYTWTGGSSICKVAATFPCTTGAGGPNCGHTSGNAQQWVGVSPGTASSATNYADAASIVQAIPYATGVAGYDTTQVPPVSSGYYTVPAAAATIPGSVVVYLTRPAGVPGGKGHAWAWQSLFPGDANRYAQSVEEWYVRGTSYSSVYSCLVNSYRYYWYYYPFTGYRQGRYLTAAADALSGSIGFTTSGLASSALVGSSRSFAPVNFNRTITH